MIAALARTPEALCNAPQCVQARPDQAQERREAARRNAPVLECCLSALVVLLVAPRRRACWIEGMDCGLRDGRSRNCTSLVLIEARTSARQLRLSTMGLLSALAMVCKPRPWTVRTLTSAGRPGGAAARVQYGGLVTLEVALSSARVDRRALSHERGSVSGVHWLPPRSGRRLHAAMIKWYMFSSGTRTAASLGRLR